MVSRGSLPLGVVEDSDEDAAMYRRIFSAAGTELRRWVSGEAALAGFESGELAMGDFAAFVVDLNLPGMDGCEVVRRLRTLDRGAGAVICVLTSSDRSVDRERAMDAGADAYLLKPADLVGLRRLPEQLATLIARGEERSAGSEP